MSKVTIIIPTRNRADFLNRAVESAYSLKYSNLEVIISNNNSSDNTKEVVDQLKRTYSNLKYIEHNKLLPLSVHWDTVIKNYSTGKYILVIPDDDVITDINYLNKVVKKFEKFEKIGFVFGNYNTVDSKGKLIDKIRARWDENMSGEFLLENFNKNLFGLKGVGVSHLTTVFSKEAYDKVGGFDHECLSPDTYLWLKMMLFYNVGFIEDNVADYMIHLNNLSKTKNLDYLFSDVLIINKIKKLSKYSLISQKKLKKSLRRLEKIFYDRYHSALLYNLIKFKELKLKEIKKINYIYIWFTIYKLIFTKR